MNLKHGLTLACIFTAALAITGCNGGGSEIATVNNASISDTDFNDYLASKASMTATLQGMNNQQASMSLQALSQGQSANVNLPETAGFQALRDLIVRQVTLQLAKEQGFVATQDKVDAEVKYRKELNEGYIKNLQDNLGMSMDLIRKQIESDLASEYILTKGVTVTDADVDDYIKNNKEQFVDPATVDLQWIVVSNEAKKASVDKALAAGQKFKDVALQYSEDPNRDAKQASVAGRPVPIQSLGGTLTPIIEKTDVNQTTDWVADGTNFDKFYIVSKTKEKAQEITPAKKEQVRRALAKQRGAQGKDINKTLLDAILNAKVEIKRSSFKAMWKTYLNGLTSQKEKMDAASNAAGMTSPATGTTAGSGTAPAATTGN